MIANRFLPCVERARSLRRSMAGALLEGLSRPLGSGPHAWTGGDWSIALGQNSLIEPLAFGAYFDLLSSEDLGEAGGGQSDAVIHDAADWLRRRVSGQELSPVSRQVLQEQDASPVITTLSEDFYSPNEITRWKRWLDMEPDNAMALSGLQGDVFTQAMEKTQRALAILASAAPELHAEVVTITREILLLQPNGAQRMSFRGASSFALWGASAFNHIAHEDWVDYFKTLVHESAHTLLFALARDEPLVLNDPKERYGSPLREDLRPMDGIFHAAFVSAREAYAIDKCLSFVEQRADTESQVLAKKLEAELNASVCSFWDCCDEIENHGLLSTLGQEILNDTTAWVESHFQVIAVDVEKRGANLTPA